MHRFAPRPPRSPRAQRGLRPQPKQINAGLVSRKGAKNTFLLCALAPWRETSAFAFSEEKSCQENKKLRDINQGIPLA
jgi:hypothetical protein